MIIKTRVIMWSIWFLLLTQLSVYETADDNEIIFEGCDEPPSHHHHHPHHHHHHHHRRHHSQIYEPSKTPGNEDDFFAKKYNSCPNLGRGSLFDPEFNNPPTRRRWTFGGFGTKNCLTKEEKQRDKDRKKQEKKRLRDEEQIRKITQKTEKLKQKIEKDKQAWEKEQDKMKEEKSKLMRQMLAPTSQKKSLFRKTF